ncbi:N-acetylmuramoyl-L-alanine amidase LytC precursor [Desulfosporosinus acididurans]|uniref:N-acetylmuramoyl-L-alanine amidase LytC n=1 Tax=Desulfosporosinus acididurans TaxID=476652 RepID=A0A0J1IQD0_9FIRM|nr:cell wall-binding repeat-containing protein [Desulfosporosinus acididurans]KLU66891.1 N-acetylmuramoyl-L-alanine amidase LytC precursor [Desulfosporosinus acididurans]
MAHLKWKIIGIVIAVFSFLIAFQNPANASPLDFGTTRIYGVRQIDTAIKVSQAGWQHADTVLLANCDHFPDALVAAPLSHQLDAPILLTQSQGVDPYVMQEIKRLGAKKVILLGGVMALSSQVETDLENAGFPQPERIWGQDQYETAQKVAERVGFKGQVILANGDQFPDALAISAYAGETETPILLTQANTMPNATKQELDTLRQKYGDINIVVVGGEAVVSSSTLTGLNNVQRIAGNDRYETAADVYDFAQNDLTATTMYVVTGENFPDALAAGALAAKQHAEIVMTQGTTLPGPTYSVLSRPTASPLNMVIIGGPAVISDQVKGMLEGTIPPSSLLAGLTIVVDPGHGGPDTGAIGPSGTYEKNNTLAVGLDLENDLRSAGARVIMTRSTDVSPAQGTYSELSDLQARTKIANDANADMFICLHNDSFSNPSASGTTSYYSSASPVADQSQALAKNVQSELVSAIGLNDRGVKDAPFYVIKNTKMPAVLIEIGFISNPNEEKLLGSPDFQEKAAAGICEGILKYKGY